MRTFDTLGAAIGWYLSHNPARQPAVNLLEPDRISTEQRDRDEEIAAFCSILSAIEGVLRDETRDAAAAFRMVWLRRPAHIVTPMFHRCDAARLLRISEPTINRHLRRVCEHLERELQQRQILIP